jgi:predicted O-methyltransferase YrrM
MNCDVCRRDQGPEGTQPLEFLGKTYNLCPFDQLEVQRFLDMRISQDNLNICWGGGKVCPQSWESIRGYLRKYKINEVLELGAGLSSELFVLEGMDLKSFDVLDFHIRMLASCRSMANKAKFHAYEYGQIPPVMELYPGKKWNFVFVDGPQERSREVDLAMKLSTHLIYLHDPNMGEQGFFPNAEWEMMPGDNKLFKKVRPANHHGQVLTLLKDHFGDKKISGIEIGTRYGCLTKAILGECQNVKKLYTVDPWLHQEGNCFEAAQPQEEQEVIKAHSYKALESFGDRVKIMPCLSDQAFKEIDEQVDFCWIDGDHTVTTAKRDIMNGLNIVRPGGILGGHDYATIKQAIDETLAGVDVFQGHDLTWWLYV